MDPGETSGRAAVREAKEERGLDVPLGAEPGAFVHEERRRRCFLAASHRGRLRVGSPKRERRSSENIHGLEWVDAKKMENISLRPARARGVCSEALARIRENENTIRF
ncbi:MAG: NUDIX domain-containing protein [Rubrobacter sp.]|nr:NUDIX domain-containing protein [Rubrobacter sp.]